MAEAVDPKSLSEPEAVEAVRTAYQTGSVTPRAIAGWIRLGYAADHDSARTALRSLISEKAQIIEDDANRKGTNHKGPTDAA